MTTATRFIDVRNVERGADAVPALDALRSSALAGEFLSAHLLAAGRVVVANAVMGVAVDPSCADHKAALRELLMDTRFRWALYDAPPVVRHLVHSGVFADTDEAWTRGGADGDVSALLDVALAARLLFGKPTETEDNLATLTRTWCGYTAESIAPRGRGRSVPSEVYGAACSAIDAVRLAAELEPLARELWNGALVREHRAARLVTAMTVRGMRLDVPAAERLWQAEQRRRRNARAALERSGVRFTEVQPRADSTVAAIRQEGVETDSYIGSDGMRRDALNGEALAKYADRGSKVAATVMAWRDANTNVSFLDQLGTALRDGRVHATISTLGATSGRMACAAPNLQAVPASLRSVFTADDEHVLVSVDFASVEMRTAAAITQDRAMVALYNAPVEPDATEEERRSRCPYWRLAWRAYGPDATPADRNRAKVVALADLYSSGVATTAAQAGITVEEARRLRAEYHAEYPALKHWWKRTMVPRIAIGDTSWTLPSGRPQHIDVMQEWQGFNRMVQGAARDILVDALFRLEDAGLIRYALLPIHDEVLFQVPAAEAQALTARIAACMETVFQGVPITVEARELGSTWLEK